MRPTEHVRDLARRYPGAWKQLAEFRQERGKGIDDWPEWCWCPMAGAYAIVSRGSDAGLDVERTKDVARLAAVGAWRATQGVYRFDPDLAEALSATPVAGALPVDLLHRLPEWCVYVESPGLEVARWRVQGFYAHLEWDVTRRGTELRLLLDTDEGLFPVVLHLSEDTLEGAMRAAFHEADRQVRKAGLPGKPSLAAYARQTADAISPLISTLLYLCSEAAEIEDSKRQGRRPTHLPHGRKISAAANAPTVWECGYRLGARLRAAQTATTEPSDGAHASPRPHVRRAHWHTYRLGPGRTQARVLWQHPILVNADPDDPGIVPAVRSVE